MLEKNVTFSESRSQMNNQINYFASKALNRDLTGFFQDRGISTESWSYEEKRLEEARLQLEELNSSYAHFPVFSQYFEDLEEYRRAFYSGRFDEVDEVSEVVKKAEERNRTLFQTLQKLESVRNGILKLEARNEPEFFSEELKEVNNTVNLIRDSRFKQARNMLTEIRNNARNKMKEIEKAGNNTEELERTIETTNFLIKPFLMGADRSLEKARNSLNEGNLKDAERKIEVTESKISSSTTYAAIFYLVLLSVSLYLWRKIR